MRSWLFQSYGGKIWGREHDRPNTTPGRRSAGTTCHNYPTRGCEKITVQLTSGCSDRPARQGVRGRREAARGRTRARQHAGSSSDLRRDRSYSGSRSVHFRAEIGSLPHRDRSSSASRSVPSTRSLKNLFSHTSPVMDYGPLSSPRPIATRPQNRMSVRMTLELLSAVPLDDRPCNDADPHRRSGSPGGQCHSDGHPPAPEPAIETAGSGATRMAGRLREPISTRKRTDLEPELDRSRAGTRPISTRK